VSDHDEDATTSPPARRRGGRDRPTLSGRDLVSEAVASLSARPWRAVLTALGTVIGVTALVATLGLSKTAGNQIVGRFDELAATDVTVTSKVTRTGLAETALPWDAEDRVRRLNGVRNAGTISDLDLRGQLVRAVPVNDPRGQTEFQMPVKAASPGLFPAVRATLLTGRTIDAAQSDRADRVAVLGPTAAAQLSINRLDNQPAIYIGDHVYVVIGILGDVGRQASLLSSVVIPEGTARRDFMLRSPATVQIEVEIGAASLIAAQSPVALLPNQPSLLKVTAPPEPRRVKAGIQEDLDSLFLLLGGVSLLVGAIGIANVTLVSVLERVGEIGLRRALGAARRHIAAQFLLESTTLGLAGGLLGAAVGVIVIVVVAAFRTWSPVLDPWVPLGAPLVGAVTGLVSGTYPALRAATMQPVEALRSSL
jgi:ABC-type antimicrobial peptide transport system permease subunit